ncbi:MAG: hypothetical protein NTW21_42365 [Verrucomicrobia bacterium]|nr:hypothetical protein [Verrucomicrobiota bacterium]
MKAVISGTWFFRQLYVNNRRAIRARTPNIDDKTPWWHIRTSGVLLGSYHLGKGRFIINAFRILESLGNNPVADRLILNLVTEGVKRSSPER